MTVALCTNCGESKFGAWCECYKCGSIGFDRELSLLLSDWNLSEYEMSQIGKAVRVISGTGLDEEIRFMLLVYYISKKWPKLLTCSINSMEPHLQEQLTSLYSNKLSDISGQEKLS